MQHPGKQHFSKQYTRWVAAIAATCAVIWLVHYKLGPVQPMTAVMAPGSAAAAADYYPASSGLASLQGADIVMVGFTNSAVLVSRDCETTYCVCCQETAIVRPRWLQSDCHQQSPPGKVATSSLLLLLLLLLLPYVEVGSQLGSILQQHKRQTCCHRL
jgi:hypothetical protein